VDNRLVINVRIHPGISSNETRKKNFIKSQSFLRCDITALLFRLAIMGNIDLIRGALSLPNPN